MFVKVMLRYITGFMPEPKEFPDLTGISGPRANERRQTAAKKCSIPGSETATDMSICLN